MSKRLNLTPEIAAQFLANMHPRQRKTSRPKVAEYAQAIRDGRWVPYVGDPIMLDRTTKKMYNGRQRCSAVVATGITIQVLLDDESDADVMFDVIDIGLRRNATQFITSSRASVRASAARVVLWHEQAFDQPPSKLVNRWQMHEVMAKVEELDDEFEEWIKYTEAAYATCHLSPSVMLAAAVLAAQRGYGEQVRELLEKLIEPAGLDPLDPAYILYRKMNHVAVYKVRRQPQQDWLLFVRCLNALINDEPLPSALHTTVSVWPDIGDTEADIKRKIGRAASRKAVEARIAKKVRAQVEAEMQQGSSSMAAASGS